MVPLARGLVKPLWIADSHDRNSTWDRSTTGLRNKIGVRRAGRERNAPDRWRQLCERGARPMEAAVVFQNQHPEGMIRPSVWLTHVLDDPGLKQR